MSEPQRKANPGDLILVTNPKFAFGKYDGGDIFEVLSANDAGVLTPKGQIFNEEFDVVDSSKLIDIVAKLVRNQLTLESQLRMTQHNVETLAQENASLTSKLNELREITDSNLADIRFLDERGEAHQISVNLRIDRGVDVMKIAEELTKLIEKGGDIE
jgi:hypothetical protein